MTDRDRRRAFVVVIAIVALAVAAIATLSPSDQRGADARHRAGLSQNQRKVVVPDREPGEAAMRTPSIPAARTTAARFAVAYLARDTGEDSVADRQALRATTTHALWQALRAPARIPPGTRPPSARFVRVNGISETASPGTLAATIEYRRANRRRYLSVVLVNQAGSWRASGISP